MRVCCLPVHLCQFWCTIARLLKLFLLHMPGYPVEKVTSTWLYRKWNLGVRFYVSPLGIAISTQLFSWHFLRSGTGPNSLSVAKLRLLPKAEQLHESWPVKPRVRLKRNDDSGKLRLRPKAKGHPNGQLISLLQHYDWGLRWFCFAAPVETGRSYGWAWIDEPLASWWSKAQI